MASIVLLACAGEGKAKSSTLNERHISRVNAKGLLKSAHVGFTHGTRAGPSGCPLILSDVLPIVHIAVERLAFKFGGLSTLTYPSRPECKETKQSHSCRNGSHSEA